MTRLPAYALGHPLRTLAVAAALVLAAAPGLARLTLRTDGAGLVPEGRPEVRYDRAIREQLGLYDPIAVVIASRHPQGVWNVRTLGLVRELTAELALLPGVEPAHLTSLATARTFRFRPGTLDLETFLETSPETAADLVRVRSDFARIGLWDGILVSRDGRSTAILVGTPPEGDRAAFYRSVRDAVAARGAAGPDRVDVVGAPVAETLLGDHILADLGLSPFLPRGWLDAGAGVAESADPAGLPPGPAGRLAARARRFGLVPLALAILALVFAIGFRRPGAALLSLVKLGACLLVVLGTMGWLGVPVYLTIAVMPVILIAIGVADEVHLLRRYRGLLGERPGGSPLGLLRETFAEMTSPVVQTSLTTVVGFLAFAISPIVPVRVFGLWTAAGVAACMLWSLTVTPALLALLPPGSWVSRPRPAAGERRPGARRGFFAGLAVLAGRHRRALLVASGLAALVALDGVRRLTVQDRWLDGFDPATPFHRAMQRFDEGFRGVHLLQAVVEAEPLALTGRVTGSAVSDDRLLLPAPPESSPAAAAPGRLRGAWIRLYRLDTLPGEPRPREWHSWIAGVRSEGGGLAVELPPRSGSPRFWLRAADVPSLRYGIQLEPFMVPATLARVRGLERYLTGRPGVGGTLGPGELVETLAFMLDPDRPGSRRIPERPEEVRALWSQYARLEGAERLRQRVAADHTRALVTVFLRGASYADFKRLAAGLDAYERRHLAPHGLTLRLAGDAAVSQAMIAAVVRTQVGSLALSLLGIFALTALLNRSALWGLCCALPPSFAVLLSFAAMGWLGIPLGVATSMFAGMTLGVGVDYSIHLLARWRRLHAAGLPREEALAATLSAVGPAIAIDAASVGLGFAVLLLSQVPVNARLGGLLVLCVASCLAATLLVVPGLVCLAPAWSRRRRAEAPASGEASGEATRAASRLGPVEDG